MLRVAWAAAESVLRTFAIRWPDCSEVMGVARSLGGRKLRAVTIPQELIQRMISAGSVAILTGPGVSAESGVPTFRDAQTGLWAKFRPEDLATPTAFRKNPKLVWEWYAWRRTLVASAKPNAAHHALVAMESMFSSFTLITQNVDGLHQMAGSRNVIELHGNISKTKCFEENRPVANWNDSSDVPPKCPNCGGLLRPAVVWFEEALPEVELQMAVSTSARCDLFLSLGTSTLVYPAASLPFRALENGATVVEINPQSTPFTSKASFALQGPAGVVLPELLDALKRARG
jgi:NAD-dependent deacetylase